VQIGSEPCIWKRTEDSEKELRILREEARILRKKKGTEGADRRRVVKVIEDELKRYKRDK
jgi:hypothetical protein